MIDVKYRWLTSKTNTGTNTHMHTQTHTTFYSLNAISNATWKTFIRLVCWSKYEFIQRGTQKPTCGKQCSLAIFQLTTVSEWVSRVQWLSIYSWTGSVLASGYSRRETARPILSSRDFRQASMQCATAKGVLFLARLQLSRQRSFVDNNRDTVLLMEKN